MEKNRPVYEKRLGHVRVAVWENLADGKPWYNVSLTRRYKEGEEWKDATTFNGLSDLAVVKDAVALAQSWIARREDTFSSEEKQ